MDLQNPGQKRGQTQGQTRGQTGRLIVHTGDRKAGSTAIQTTLAAGRVSSPDRTVLYPSEFAHNYLMREIKAAASLEETSLARLMQTIAAQRADVTILSAEHFEDIAPGKMREIHNTYFARVTSQVTYITYLRPHAARLLSDFSEQTKIGAFDGSPEAFFQLTLKRRRFLYQPRLERWRKHFGKTHILRPMIRSELHNRDVVEDFLCTVFGPGGYGIAGGPAVNESVGLRDLMVLKLMQRQLRGQERLKRGRMGWLMAQFLNAKGRDPQDKLTLHRALAEQVAEAYRADAQAVDAARFGGRPLLQTELEKAVDTAPLEAQSLVPEDHISPAERRTIQALAQSIDGLLAMPGRVGGHLSEALDEILRNG